MVMEGANYKKIQTTKNRLVDESYLKISVSHSLLWETGQWQKVFLSNPLEKVLQ